jgi:hypothetical protein
MTEAISSGRGVSIVPLASSIRIRGAVFTDGTYEGAVGPACSFEGFQKGRKLWLTTAIALLDSQITETTTETPEAAIALKEKLLSLRYPAVGQTQDLSAVSKDCQNLQTAISAAFNGQKLQLLRELETIITTRPAPPINFKKWLQTTADRYRAWLARL